IDRAFERVNDGVEKLPPVPAEVPESIRLTGTELREARGEARLLGEELGIRLPRHVSNFIADLPGVGKALSAAFSATAILFVAQAVIELTKKVTEAVAEFVYAKSIWEDTQASVVSLNTELTALGKEYDDLKKKADDYGKSALQLATEH